MDAPVIINDESQQSKKFEFMVPQTQLVHRGRLDIVVVQRQVRGFFGAGKLWSFRSCCSSLAVVIPFVPQILIPHGPVCSAGHGDSTVAAYFCGRCSCCQVVQILRCCRGEALGSPTVAARREICDFLRPFVFQQSLVRCSPSKYRILDFSWRRLLDFSRVQRFFVQHWIHALRQSMGAFGSNSHDSPRELDSGR